MPEKLHKYFFTKLTTGEGIPSEKTAQLSTKISENITLMFETLMVKTHSNVTMGSDPSDMELSMAASNKSNFKQKCIDHHS